MIAPRLFSTQRILLSTLAFTVFILASCSKKVSFITSGVVPAAQGYIKIANDENRNYTIDVDVRRLADPKRLNPPKSVYVVWMETKKNGIKNLGRLNSNSGFFSSELRGLLHTITPFKPERVFVTAEDRSNLPTPGSQVVLTTKEFN